MAAGGESLGSRIRRLRKRRGLSQKGLGELIDRSEPWVSQVERGVRGIDRMSVLENIAAKLDVPLSELAAEAPVVAAASERPAPAVELSLALSSSTALSAMLDERATRESGELSQAAELAWSSAHRSDYQQVAELLTGLLPELEFAARSTRSAAARRAVNAALARSYHACASVLSKLSEPAGAWVAADRAIAAAERTGDALLMAEGAFRLVLVFQSARQFDRVMQTASTAAEALTGKVDQGDPAALSLWGALHLQMAITAARANHADEAYEYLGAARQAAERLGEDRNEYDTEFGPTNVAVHEVSVAVELGDAGTALRAAVELDPTALSAERRSRHLLDLARAHAQRRNTTAVIECLQQALDLAPEQMTGHPVVNAILADLQRGDSGRDPAVRALAERVGLTT